MKRRKGFPGAVTVMGVLLVAAMLVGMCRIRICQARCTLEEPSAEDYAIEEKKRSLAREYGLQDPHPGQSAVDIVAEKKRAAYEECIRQGEKVLKALGQQRYEETKVENGLFQRDKITGKMWFIGPDGKREIKIY